MNCKILIVSHLRASGKHKQICAQIFMAERVCNFFYGLLKKRVEIRVVQGSDFLLQILAFNFSFLSKISQLRLRVSFSFSRKLLAK
jgi:hypothetical protein